MFLTVFTNCIVYICLYVSDLLTFRLRQCIYLKCHNTIIYNLYFIIFIKILFCVITDEYYTSDVKCLVVGEKRKYTTLLNEGPSVDLFLPFGF